MESWELPIKSQPSPSQRKEKKNHKLGVLFGRPASLYQSHRARQKEQTVRETRSHKKQHRSILKWKAQVYKKKKKKEKNADSRWRSAVSGKQRRSTFVSRLTLGKLKSGERRVCEGEEEEGVGGADH